MRNTFSTAFRKTFFYGRDSRPIGGKGVKNYGRESRPIGGKGLKVALGLFLPTQGNYCPNLVKIGTGKQTLERTQTSGGKKEKKKGRYNVPIFMKTNRVLPL